MAFKDDAVAGLPADARQIVAGALEEDAPYGDITCRTFVDADSVIDAVVRAREALSLIHISEPTRPAA